VLLAAFALVPGARTHRRAEVTAPPVVAENLDGRLPDGAPDVPSNAFAASATADFFLALSVVESATATPAAPVATPTPAPATLVAVAAVAVAAEAPTAAAIRPPRIEPTVQPAAAAPTTARYASRPDIEAALAQTPWPAELWPRIIAIAMCESGVDTNRDGYYDVVDTYARGAGGRYIGVLQIGADHRFSRAYDLTVLLDNLNAGYELWAAAGGSFGPWGCRYAA
jgi:hypothetical protein